MYTRVECCELIEQLVKQLTSQLKPEEFILKRDTDLCISVPNIAGQGQADATLHCDVAVFKTYYGTQHSTYPFVVFNFWPQVDKGAEQCPGQTEACTRYITFFLMRESFGECQGLSVCLEVCCAIV